MANIVQLKRSSVSGRVPDAANVEVGEPVVNLADQIIFTKDGSGTVKVIGAGTTSNISEGTNLYFSNTRVATALSSGVVVGNIIPSDNNISSLGSPEKRFKELFISGSSIYLGNIVLTDTGTTVQVEDAGGNVVFTGIDSAGFFNSTTTSIPTGDYGDLSSSTDAFGVSLINSYSFMDPSGRLIEEDLGTL